MGIAPYKYFTYDGESSRNYDVYLTGEGVFNAPERDVEMVEIPGRNGNYALDHGKFKNITVTYKAGIVDVSESNFADKVSAVRNWLCSKVGYKRLSDDYNPNEYRMAVYRSGVEIDHVDLKTGEFDITFECKPQRWLKNGETVVTLTSGNDITNPTLFDAHPQLQVYGYGDIDLGGQSVKVNNVSIGSVLIANSQRFNAPKYESLIASVGCDVGMLNNGDDILVSNIKSSIAYQTNTGTFLIDGTGIVINSTTNATANAQLVGPTKYSVTVTANDITFSKGTSASSTATVSQTINYKISGVAYSKSTVFTIVTSYDGNDTISFSASVSNITSSDVLKYLLGVKSNDIYGDSSKSALGNPLYIDLDIGECWNEDSGTPVSINNAVSLPAELPTLPSGNTTITFDNTFTKVDIVPRWWKV